MFGKSIENYDKFQLDNTTICYYDEDNYYDYDEDLGNKKEDDLVL